jgi:hypothetical protein
VPCRGPAEQPSARAASAVRVEPSAADHVRESGHGLLRVLHPVAAAVEQLAQLCQSRFGQPGPKQRPAVSGQAQSLRPVGLVQTQRTARRRLPSREPAVDYVRRHPRRQTSHGGTRVDVQLSPGHPVEDLLPAAYPQLSLLADGRVLVRPGGRQGARQLAQWIAHANMDVVVAHASMAGPAPAPSGITARCSPN